MRRIIALILLVVFAVGVFAFAQSRQPAAASRELEQIETKLAPLSTKLGKPKPGDWLAEHPERGQNFKEYLAAKPVRRSKELTTIYLCLIGDFTPKQQEVLKLAQEYLAIFYQSPVKIHREIKLADVPKRARRHHPTYGMEQIKTTYVLDEVLKPARPRDALAYIAFTSSDLFPQDDWNYVFGQASLRDRTGVWSIYRNGDPAESAEAFQLCLRRTLSTASHETGHILTIEHCTANECNMNGANNQPESDRHPLHLCPVCLRKVLWNLQSDPDKYLGALETFCEKHKLEDEAKWYAAAREKLK